MARCKLAHNIESTCFMAMKRCLAAGVLAGLFVIFPIVFLHARGLHDSGSGVTTEADSELQPETPATKASSQSYHMIQTLGGAVFKSKAQNGKFLSELKNVISWSVVTSFSPAVEDHVKLMFQESFSECKFYAMGPALVRWNGTLIANIRVWLSQFLLHKLDKGKRPIESWQENYIYTVTLDENYRMQSSGSLLGIPTTANTHWSYRKDGPMDPRAFVFKDHLYLVYYSYAQESTSTGTVARMYLWDYGRKVKVKLNVTGLALQGSSDINWVPIIVKRQLYFVYSFDPLRILTCDPDSGHCTVAYDQDPKGEYKFSKQVDHLRGGTPFVEYQYPYYISVAHSAVFTTYNWNIYRTHFVVISVEPWRMVYVSDNMATNQTWLYSVPVVIEAYILKPFWYPTALITRDRDTVDIGCHLNDHSSYVVRLSGVADLMGDVIRKDRIVNAGRNRARVRAIQQYVLDCYKREFKNEHQIAFQGDLS